MEAIVSTGQALAASVSLSLTRSGTKLLTFSERLKVHASKPIVTTPVLVAAMLLVSMHPALAQAGGTGSLELTAAEEAVTEVTAGSGFYAPALFDHYSRFSLTPAAGFALPIVRKPAPKVATALGGGSAGRATAGLGAKPDPVPAAGATAAFASRSNRPSMALKTSWHLPQRTQPSETLSWSCTTRKTVPQLVHRVARLIAKSCHPGHAGRGMGHPKNNVSSH